MVFLSKSIPNFKSSPCIFLLPQIRLLFFISKIKSLIHLGVRGLPAFDEKLYDLETFKFWKERDDGTIDLNLNLDVDIGFFHSRDGSSVDTDSVSLGYNGLLFDGSVKRIKLKCIGFSSSGWAGTDPYTKEMSSGLDNTKTILVMFFSARRISDDDVHSMLTFLNATPPYNDRFVRNIYARYSGGDYLINVTIGEDPTLYENMYATVIYSES